MVEGIEINELRELSSNEKLQDYKKEFKKANKINKKAKKYYKKIQYFKSKLAKIYGVTI